MGQVIAFEKFVWSIVAYKALFRKHQVKVMDFYPFYEKDIGPSW